VAGGVLCVCVCDTLQPRVRPPVFWGRESAVKRGGGWQGGATACVGLPFLQGGDLSIVNHVDVDDNPGMQGISDFCISHA